jgi:putative ABC transport system ATP-binding protein
MKSVVVLEDLKKYYNIGTSLEVRAIDGVSLKINPNDYALLDGPSGSGKTTLLNLMSTLDRPTGGRILLFGKNCMGYSGVELSRIRRKRIGIVFQDFQLIQHLTAWENVALPLIPMGVSSKERYRRACELLEELGLSPRIEHGPEQMSGGEQQRVAIARALVNEPEILFADEPTSNIDEESIQSLLRIFRKLKKREITLVVTSHHPIFIREADRTFRLKSGRIEGKLI